MSEMVAVGDGSDIDQVFRAAPAHVGQGTMVEQARAIAEVRAAVLIAMERPRNVATAVDEMRKVCQIRALAERAFFRVERGGEFKESADGKREWVPGFVNGESIDLARELARCWGNIDYGVKELVRDDVRAQSELIAFAWDLQTNARAETTFIVPHKRYTKKGTKPLVSTQEVYENNASYAGRRLREQIFAVLPVWFKSEAADICHATLTKGDGTSLEKRVTDCVASFERIGITREQIEKKIGRKIEGLLAEDVANLRVAFKSILRGEVTKDDEFPVEVPDGVVATQGASKLDQIEGAIAADAKALEPESPPEAKPTEPKLATRTAKPAAPKDDDRAWTSLILADIRNARDQASLTALTGGAAFKTRLARYDEARPELKEELTAAIATRSAQFSAVPSDEPPPPNGAEDYGQASR